MVANTKGNCFVIRVKEYHLAEYLSNANFYWIIYISIFVSKVVATIEIKPLWKWAMENTIFTAN